MRRERRPENPAVTEPRNEESALIRRCRQGDQDAIRQLVERYQRPVYSLVYKAVGNEEDARDLTQEAFVRAIRALDRFDPNRPFRNWIFRIASNLAVDHYRRARMRTISIDVDADDESGLHAPILVDERPTPDRVSDASRLSDRLAALVDRLPPGYRTVIHLRHYEQLAYEEIAEALDIPLGTVKARLHRAHRRLRELWEADRPGPAGEGEDES
ncbi:MAG: sigma-70 family RNA polymerase sigma factor [Candidatus Eisenbacteria bacterium]|nr:sigma-70 family RNA polymerase sigma factor [Candidatus Eisenbacteria bacterium]